MKRMKRMKKMKKMKGGSDRITRLVAWLTAG